MTKSNSKVIQDTIDALEGIADGLQLQSYIEEAVNLLDLVEELIENLKEEFYQ